MRALTVFSLSCHAALSVPLGNPIAGGADSAQSLCTADIPQLSDFRRDGRRGDFSREVNCEGDGRERLPPGGVASSG